MLVRTRALTFGLVSLTIRPFTPRSRETAMAAPVLLPALAEASGGVSSLDGAAQADWDAAGEVELVRLARSEGWLRCALAELAARFAESEGFARLGFASMADWAAERVGRSGRTLYDHARVGAKLRGLPELRAALVAGRLPFAKVRLVARVATPENERRWIAFARSCSADALAREVRKIDAGSLEYGGLARDLRRARLLEVACTPEVVGLWGQACRVARQVSGQRLPLSGCAEWIAAEVASALPIAGEAETAREPAREPPSDGEGSGCGRAPPERESARRPPWLDGAEAPREAPQRVPAPAPPELAALLVDLEAADAFELERRLRIAFESGQRLAARIGPRLERVLRIGVHRLLGYRSREAYQRERLGLDPSECRALLRIEGAARRSPAFCAAWRAGRLSFLQAAALVPLVHAELSEAQVGAWIARARGFALRRLRDDVEAALELREQDFPSWLRSGGLPQEAGEAARDLESREREIGANRRAADRAPQPAAAADLERCRVAMIVESEVAQLFRAVHCSVRRQLERQVGRPVTPGEALGWICAHALRAWGALEGWDCARGASRSRCMRPEIGS